MPKGKTEDLPLFVVPKAHWVATLNGCHRDVGHQGCDHTLSWLWEHFWWPGMINQMQQSIKYCVHCLQHEGDLPTVPVHPIVASAPLDLLHIDFTSIETTMELKQLPIVANVLVFQDHFMKHIMVYVTPNQTAKTVAKFLYQGNILIFGALARLLSKWGASYMSNIIDKLCMLLSVKKLQTTPYHPQTNGLVERSHQSIMWMIGKLAEDQKANLPGHLAEIVQAYNATQSAMMWYSPHYLMFGCSPSIPVNFTFPPLECRGPPKRFLCQACGWKCGYCLWPIEGCPLGSTGPVNGRSPMTETVLQPKDRCLGAGARWSGLSEGWCL